MRAEKGYISSNVSFIDLKLPTSPPTNAINTTTISLRFGRPEKKNALTGAPTGSPNGKRISRNGLPARAAQPVNLATTAITKPEECKSGVGGWDFKFGGEVGSI